MEPSKDTYSLVENPKEWKAPNEKESNSAANRHRCIWYVLQKYMYWRGIFVLQVDPIDLGAWLEFIFLIYRHVYSIQASLGNTSKYKAERRSRIMPIPDIQTVV